MQIDQYKKSLMTFDDQMIHLIFEEFEGNISYDKCVGLWFKIKRMLYAN